MARSLDGDAARAFNPLQRRDYRYTRFGIYTAFRGKSDDHLQPTGPRARCCALAVPSHPLFLCSLFMLGGVTSGGPHAATPTLRPRPRSSRPLRAPQYSFIVNHRCAAHDFGHDHAAARRHHWRKCFPTPRLVPAAERRRRGRHLALHSGSATFRVTCPSCFTHNHSTGPRPRRPVQPDPLPPPVSSCCIATCALNARTCQRRRPGYSTTGPSTMPTATCKFPFRPAGGSTVLVTNTSHLRSRTYTISSTASEGAVSLAPPTINYTVTSKT